MVSMFAITISAARGDELHWATNDPEPERTWQPGPEVLKNAYRISQGETDTIQKLNQAISMCDDYIKAHPDDVSRIDAYVIMAESYSNLGEYQDNDEEKLKAYEQGKAAAQKIIDLAPGRWDGWFWWSANVGRIAQIKGILTSLLMLQPLMHHLNKAHELAPNSALVLDGLGLMYRELPWIAGGSLTKSKQYLEKTLSMDPHFTLARYDLALTLLAQSNKAEAKKELETLVHEKDPVWLAHYLLWEKPRAGKLIKELK